MRRGRNTVAVVALVFGLGAFAVWAGNLQPPGSPGSTMRTLDEIYNLLMSIFERQEGGTGGEGLGAEPRLIGCMQVDDGEYTSGDPGDLADPICGDMGTYDPPWTRVVAGMQGVESPIDPGSGQVTGSAQYETFVVTKNINRGSVLLFKDLVQSAVIGTVTIHWYRSVGMGTIQHYATVVLDNARVLDLRQQQIPTRGGAFLHVEDVAFGYQQITWTYEPSATSFVGIP